MLTIFCPNCGEEISIHSRRCAYCGFKNRRNLIKFTLKKFLSKISFKIARVVILILYILLFWILTSLSSEFLLKKLKNDWSYITFFSNFLGKDRVEKIDKHLYKKNIDDMAIHNKIKELNLLSPLANKQVRKEGKTVAEYDMQKQRQFLSFLYAPEKETIYKLLMESPKFTVKNHPYNYTDPAITAIDTPILSVYDLPLESIPKNLATNMTMTRILYLVDAVLVLIALYSICILIICIPLCIIRDLVKKYLTCYDVVIIR